MMDAALRTAAEQIAAEFDGIAATWRVERHVSPYPVEKRRAKNNTDEAAAQAATVRGLLTHIDKLEAELAAIKNDPSIGRLEVAEPWPETPE